jgi:transposase
MLVVETIGRIRREHFVKGKPIKQIARELKLSRNTVRKVLRSQETSFAYEREIQPRPKLGRWTDELERMLTANAQAPARERLTLIRLFEDLRDLGYDGGYDAVRRYARQWGRKTAATNAAAFVPLSFAPGEAYQFDWSHEIVVMGGVTMAVKVAHMRLCHSRMFIARAYPRETQEMVFDARRQACAACVNLAAARLRLLQGRLRARRLRQHENRGGGDLPGQGAALQSPLSATVLAPSRRSGRLHPGLGLGEGAELAPAKAGVENQVGLVRERFFTPRLRVKDFDELNALLADKCVDYARKHDHPERPGVTIWAAFEEERSFLIPYRGRFDGFHALPASVSKTCLVRFDNNKYSVNAAAVGRPVDIHAYADRIVIRQDGRVVGEHRRCFGRDQTIYDPWHYVPVLVRKPGALRNGAPFKDWLLPGALERVRRKLAGSNDGDRQMAPILAAVLTDGLAEVEAACAEALAEGVASADVILNILARRRDPPPIAAILTPAALALRHAPVADCARYDRLRRP